MTDAVGSMNLSKSCTCAIGSAGQTDAARVLGHTIAGMSYGVYSSGPGLKRLAAVVETIEYEGLKVAKDS